MTYSQNWRAMDNPLLQAEIRAKLTLRIPPCYGRDDWYEKWVVTLDEATEGIMDVLGKYDIKERGSDE